MQAINFDSVAALVAAILTTLVTQGGALVMLAAQPTPLA